MSTLTSRQLIILGTRGIPGCHGGFETFAQRLALHMVQVGWKVTVYCQGEGPKARPTSDVWSGVHRRIISVGRSGPVATILFDLESVLDAAHYRDAVFLTLGYNTALFTALLRIRGRTNLMNMDGLEWRRRKWRWYQRAWLWANERIGVYVAHHLIADHPGIREHLERLAPTKRISMIPYGADSVADAELGRLARFGLCAGQYLILIARPEPENSVLELVRAFSAKVRGVKFAVLGRYDVGNSYHDLVQASASNEVIFLGPIYDPEDLQALRRFSLAYAHGHQVGGTNPSLVEAMGAGNAVIAHDNVFNRWVAGEGAVYFDNEDSCERLITQICCNGINLPRLRRASIERHNALFRWDIILSSYERLLVRACTGM